MAWKKEASMAARIPGPPVEGPVEVTIQAHPPDKRRRDLDNIIKPVLDALEGPILVDDSQVTDLACRWDRTIPKATLRITIQPIALSAPARDR